MKHLTLLKKIALLLLPNLFITIGAFSMEATSSNANSTNANSLWFNGAFLVLFATIIILLVVIAGLGKIVKTLIEEETKKVVKKRLMQGGKILGVALLLCSTNLHAQDVVPAATTSSSIVGLDPTLFWVMISTIGIEFIVVLVLLNALYQFLITKELIKPIQSHLPSWLKWNTMLGSTVPVEKEEELLTDHDYDGIQELDNGMPPMLKYIFIATIFAAFIYWGHYETFGTGATQLEEYESELVQAEKDKALYLKKAGNLIDENSVVLVNDPSSLASGEKIYTTNCVPCHGDKGQGGVGPNLTDKFWLHGGGIQNIFKVIKYGVAEKGMRSWQSEIKPSDIQNVSSYILQAFGNRNVAGGKEPQGNAYESNPSSDSISAKAEPIDSTIHAAKKK